MNGRKAMQSVSGAEMLCTEQAAAKAAQAMSGAEMLCKE